MVLAGLLERVERGDQPLVVGIARRVRAQILGESLHRTGERRRGAERHRGDAIPGQWKIKGALADVLGADARRQADVRLDAAQLGALAGDPVELADRHGQLPLGRLPRPAIERNEILHRALAEGGLPEHHAAVVILYRRREDFRGRRAGAVHQHRQRAAIGDARLRILQHLDAAVGGLELHHRAMVDEQAAERGGFRQVAAAVATQVEHQCVERALCLQLADQPPYVARGGAVVGVAGAARVVVLVKTRHGDDADPQHAIADAHLARFLLGRLVLQRDLAAGQCDHLLVGARSGATRQDLQAHLRIALAADQLHDVIEAPADHVGKRAFTALADRHDPVVGLERVGGCGRPTRQ